MLKDLNTINIADNANNLLDDKNFSLEKIIEEEKAGKINPLSLCYFPYLDSSSNKPTSSSAC
ncbi:hypothetical protein [Paratissierella segnis]|jgi:hypothetical protein|uniref:Uncharacterized protein n=1 Tax=Paratissierella segnis TaxID=2763679 RepID=A0A926EXP2_9FIRM|nr:hypothetical protein [Paratissierella segnis]MBC8589457.1 hypothetical protein [Paratissierella segnis]